MQKKCLILKLALIQKNLVKKMSAQNCKKKKKSALEGCIGLGTLMLTAYYINHAVRSQY